MTSLTCCERAALKSRASAIGPAPGFGGVEQDGSDLLAQRRAARLAGEGHGVATLAQPLGQPDGLLGLAGAIGALQHDEAAAAAGRARGERSVGLLHGAQRQARALSG